MERYAMEPAPEEFADRLRTVQLGLVLSGMPLTLIANCFVAASASVVMWYSDRNDDIFWWLGAVVVLNILRSLMLLVARLLNWVEVHQSLLAGTLVGGALASGGLWALLPTVLSDVGKPTSAYVTFILAGVSAGAMIQSVPYKLNAQAFFGPPMIALSFVLLTDGEMVQFIVGINVVLLTLIMFRGGRAAERGFLKTHAMAFRATSLATSLSQANDDISRSNHELEIIATRDPLTDLANRSLFNDHLSEKLGGAPDDGHTVALLVLDIDLFKTVNDTFGHTIGDTVLVAFARVLRDACGEGDLVARLGGDEFAVVVSGPEAEARAEAIASCVLAINGRSPKAGDPTSMIGTSIGLAVCRRGAETAEQLFSNADAALYEAKAQGRRRLQRFDETLRAMTGRRHEVETRLETALSNGEIMAFFQPQALLSDRRVVGFETLARWLHPDIGPVAPDEIVNAASRLHLLDRLTEIMARSACELIHRLDALGMGDTIVSVNVSPREFGVTSPAATLIRVAAETGIAPERLEVEITEETLLDARMAAADLSLLDDAGFPIAVDDFGMGHSSLAYLLKLNVSRLKIDRSFVDGIADSSTNRALVSALVSAGRALSIDIIAEGVEREADCEVLRMLGCRYGQGFLFGRAMSLAEALACFEQSEKGLGRSTA